MGGPTDMGQQVSRRDLLKGSGVAVAVAALVLVTAVLPAEYGIDPTGIGTAVGFTKLRQEPAGPEVTTAVDDGNRTLLAYRATWTLRETRLGTFEGYLSQYDDTTLPLDLNLTNLTAVTAYLRWDDRNTSEGKRSAPDYFEVQVFAPDGRASKAASAPNGEDGRGNLSTTLTWASARFPGEDGDGTLRIPTGEPDASGVGRWEVRVRAYTIGGFPDGTPGTDDGNAWNLTLVAESYAAEVETESAGRGLRDTVQITLRPGQSVEYKLLMDEGAEMEYAWKSTLPVYSDFHGEPHENPDAFRQYAVETATANGGTFEAPFAGRHGWFWQNDEDQPLTITLETRGEYTILGVV